MLLGHDSGFRLIPWNLLKNYFYSRSPTINFGMDWSVYKAFLVTQFPETILSSVTGSVVWGQHIALVLWFFIIGFAMWLGIYLVFPDNKYRFLRLWSSLFAMYNFYILQGWFIAERAKFSLFAALPIAVALLYRSIILKKNIVTHSLVFGILYFLLNGGGSPPLYGATFVGLACTFIIFSISGISESGRGVLKRLCLIALGFSFCFFILNAYWIMPQIGLYLGTYSQAVGDYGGIEGLIAWERMISKNASVINLLRLQGIPDWYDNIYHPFAHQFFTNNLLIIASFLPAILVFVGGIFLLCKRIAVRESRYILSLYIILFIGLVLAAGSHPPFGAVYIWAMRHVPGFAIFRSSFYKFAPLVWVPMIILSGFILNEVVYRIKNRFAKGFVAVCLLTALLCYHYPFFISNFFQFSKKFTTRVTVPSYVTASANVMNKADPYSGNILLYPPLDRGFINKPIDTYKWGFYSLDILPRSISTIPIIANDATGPGGELINRVYESLESRDTYAFFNVATILRIRSILVRRDIQTSSSQPIPDIAPIAASFGLTKIFDQGEWQLWTLPSPSVPPLIQAVSAVNFFRGDLSVSGSDIIGQGDALPVVETGSGTNQKMINSIAKSIIYGSECYFCKKDEWDTYVFGITLPTPRILPGSIAYRYVRWKEERESAKAKSDTERIDVLIAHAQTRLGEYVALGGAKNAGHLQSAQLQYESAMNEAVKIMEGLAPRERTIYANRILAYLLAQQRELRKAPDFESNFQTMIARVQPRVWMGDGQQEYRYGLTVDTASYYQLLVYEVAPQVLKVDGSLLTSPKNLFLGAGYHTIEFAASVDEFSKPAPSVFAVRKQEFPQSDPPNVTFTQKNPDLVVVHIENAQHPFLLLYNTGFDSRWKLGDSKGTREENRQVRTNGFANGWIIDKQGTYDATIYYQPQNIFYLGGVITMFGLMGGIIYLTRRKIKKAV